jgi:hypothetical protein
VIIWLPEPLPGDCKFFGSRKTILFNAMFPMLSTKQRQDEILVENLEPLES